MREIIGIDPALPQWKGNLHCHSTESDGARTPQEIVGMYERAGYDFLAITDHRKVTDPAPLRTKLLMIPGTELDYILYRRHRQAVHIVGVGVPLNLMETEGILDMPQQGVDAITAAGGRAIFAHPAWSVNDPDVPEELHGLSAVEVYNHMSDEPWNGRRGDSSVILDLNWAHDCGLPFVAGDDAHRYQGDACHSAVIASAPELSREGILDALGAGRVYASQGPRIKEFRVADGRAYLRCSPAVRIIFNSNALYARERVVEGQDITEAVYPLKDVETYIRAEVLDAQGRRAWTSPISLLGLG